MSRRASTSVVLLVVLVSLLALLGGGSFYLLQQERSRSFSLDEELRVSAESQRIVEAKLRDSDKMAAMLEAGLKEARNEIDALTVQLKSETTAKNEALQRIAAIQSDLDAQSRLRTALEEKLQQSLPRN